MHKKAWALFLLLIGSAVTAQAQTGSLTLACKGTVASRTDAESEPISEPISMGIIVNLTARTVQGFGAPGVLDIPVGVIGANDVTILFEGTRQD